MADQITLFEDNAEYEAFTEKFKPRKTTDDCYTPPLVYAAVCNWACAEYGIDPTCVVRPFYPGGDYENFDYPEDCVVLDNPPFSILSKICEFYLDRGISFFLFAPALTAFSGRKISMRMNHIICNATITYENGAVVQTAFVTSFGGDIIAQTSPALTAAIKNAVEMQKNEIRRTLPKYDYPDYVLTASMLQKYSKYGIEFKVRRNECVHISALDEQKKRGKTIYGSGFLLAERAAAERAAAERAAAERAAAEHWALSPREYEIIRSMRHQREETDQE